MEQIKFAERDKEGELHRRGCRKEKNGRSKRNVLAHQADMSGSVFVSRSRL